MSAFLRFTSSYWLAVALMGVASGACTEKQRREQLPDQDDPDIGDTAFVSAAGPLGGAYRGPQGETPASDADGGGAERTIEEGDIYRALRPGLVLNLNAYRGLQVIDVSDPRAPAVVGGLRVSGSPVELYVVGGDRAVVLMNDWYGYSGAPTLKGVAREQGGVVWLVDLSDPRAPVALDHAVVAGYLMTSRLATGAAQAPALYVAASLWQMYDGVVEGDGGVGVAVASSDRTVVRGFAIDARRIVPRDEIDLGGWVSDIHATPEALLVARTDWSSSWSGSSGPSGKVAVVDISSPDGAMVLGADVPIAGQVKSQFNLDVRGDVLRVVSEGSWDGALDNHLETFDVSDIQRAAPIDHARFGAGESLFATLFVGDDKAFVVTYLRQDPFHAFHIAADGTIDERAAFVVSGWNDFFRATADGRRLIGVGIDDADNKRSLAVSLYDISDLDSPSPLVAREAASLAGAWSEASWDHRAFSVIEDAVAVPSASDPQVVETGLVLLPYAGWDESGYASGVQLFTFSDTTLTARGALAHETPVRRSFLTGEDVAASLSDVSLSLHDIADPDAPVALGEVMLAPNYPEIDVYGDYGLRHRETAGYQWWGTHAPPPGRAEVIALAGDPDRATPVAGFDVVPGASLTRVGDLAVAMSATWSEERMAWETTVETWDMAQPTAPEHRGTLVTHALQPAWGRGGYYGAPMPAVDCFDCGWGYGAAPRGTVVGDAIAFIEGVSESEPAGTQHTCVTYPPGGGGGSVDPDDGSGGDGSPSDPGARQSFAGSDGESTYYTGRIECVSTDGGPEACFGGIYACSGLEVECVLVGDPESIGAVTECRDAPVTRYWTRWVVHVLDLSDPAAPSVPVSIDLPEDEEGVALLADGATLWVATREPTTVPDDGRSYVRYLARAVDLSVPAAPIQGPAVNVPGVLIAVRGDDLFTLDFMYDEDHVESAIARSTLVSDDLARLEARHRIQDRQIEMAILDGAGHVLVSHSPTYWWYGYAADAGTSTSSTSSTTPTAGADETWETRLTVLDVETLAELSTTPIDTWATLRWADAGRALFQVPGGLLVMSLADPAAPSAQAFFATAGWPEELVVAGDRVYFAAGLYGVYGFDLDSGNLLSSSAR